MKKNSASPRLIKASRMPVVDLEVGYLHEAWMEHGQERFCAAFIAGAMAAIRYLTGDMDYSPHEHLAIAQCKGEAPFVEAPRRRAA
jgi:hypothetical protein